MKVACGTDIIEIDRIKKSIEKYEEKFKENLYTEKEIEYCESRYKNINIMQQDLRLKKRYLKLLVRCFLKNTL